MEGPTSRGTVAASTPYCSGRWVGWLTGRSSVERTCRVNLDRVCFGPGPRATVPSVRLESGVEGHEGPIPLASQRMDEGGGDDVKAALPGYEVTGLLGRGAMGEVLGGRHERLGRDVAIKRLPAAFAGDPEVRERFGDEARVLASLNHPHIVPVYDYVESEGLCLLVMESLPGGTVWDRFTGAGITMTTACAAVLATCAGLAYAHEKRVLHRDVKPDNLMFDAEGGLKVTDFGIATVFGGDETLATVDGGVVGTPAYMAPEQAEGRPVGPAADVYAAATMLYELLSGRLPFDTAEEPNALLRARIEQDPVPLDRVAPSVPVPLVAATMKGLARAPEDRYESAEAFGVAIATAASQSWGPAWLASSEVNLMASGAIAGALEAPSAAAEPTTTPRSTAGPGAARETRITGDRDAEGEEAAAATIVPGAVPVERVRGAEAGHEKGADLVDLERDDLVSVRDILRPPPTPWPAIIGALALVVAMVVVAFTGLGGPDRDELGQAGRISVDGVDLAAGQPVPVDLGQDVLVRVDRLPRGARGATQAQLELSALGLPTVSSAIRPLLDDPGGEFQATRLPAGNLRLLSSGTVTGTVVLLGAGDGEVFATEFALEPDQPPFASAAGAVGLLLAFAWVAYTGAMTRRLRSGHKRFSTLLGLVGALAGVDLVLLFWQAGGDEPSTTAVVMAAVLGAAAWLVGGWALGRLGRRRRINRAVERATLGE